VDLRDLPGQPRMPDAARRGSPAEIASYRLLGHHTAEQFRGLAVGRQLGFQLDDPLARRDQLGVGAAGRP